jgi:hypothetical protein
MEWHIFQYAAGIGVQAVAESQGQFFWGVGPWRTGTSLMRIFELSPGEVIIGADDGLHRYLSRTASFERLRFLPAP